MKKYKIFIFLILFLLPVFFISAQTENAGIIPSNIWYSKDPFQENDKIKIYTVVYNPNNKELSGTVIFFDDKIFLGKKNFVVPAKSIKDVSIDWTVTAGDHLIFAKIENAKFLISKDKYEDVYIAENKTVESKRVVSKKIDSKNPIDDPDTFSNIQEMVEKNTPAFVTKAINSTVNTLEKVREDGISFSIKEKDIIRKRIEDLNKNESTGEILEEDNQNMVLKEKLNSIKKENTNNLLKPLNYIKLFLFNVFLFIFEHKILFYGILFLVLFTILRFIWRLIF